MKASKISLMVVLALALTMGLAAASWAGPGGGGMWGGKCAMNLTPDQAGQFFDLKEKFRTDTADLRKQLMIKHAEMATLKKAEKPDQAVIDAKQKELKALWDQMKEKRTAFQAEAAKISPDLAKGCGPGMGGGMGHGRGMGAGACPMVAPGGTPAPATPAK